MADGEALVVGADEISRVDRFLAFHYFITDTNLKTASLFMETIAVCFFR